MGKSGRKNKVYSAEFKKCVIIDMRVDMREHHLSYNETIRKYWDITKGQEANYRKQLQLWERIYLEEGIEGLMKERRGRACHASGTRKCRPHKLDKRLRKI